MTSGTFRGGPQNTSATLQANLKKTFIFASVTFMAASQRLTTRQRWGRVPHAGEEGPHTCAGGPSGRPLFFYTRPNRCSNFYTKSAIVVFSGLRIFFVLGVFSVHVQKG